jgi:Ni/Co efflux regulator RcnB
VPVAQLDVASLQKDSKHEATIFPQQAALNALEAAATTHRANAIAQYDPRASSPQAAQLAFDAVAEAKTHESCQLVRISLGVSAYGVEQYSYELRHPCAGTFAVSVDGTFDLTKKSDAKITLYQPLNPDKPLARSPKLICFDLSTETLEVDVASFRRLQSKYMMDSAICAVLAAAFAESSMAETKRKAETFEAPPLTPKSKKEVQKRSKKSCWRRSKRDVQKEVADEKEKLPSVTRGILFLLGFSFEAIVWLLGLGVRVLSRVVVCASGIVSKK